MIVTVRGERSIKYWSAVVFVPRIGVGYVLLPYGSVEFLMHCLMAEGGPVRWLVWAVVFSVQFFLPGM